MKFGINAVLVTVIMVTGIFLATDACAGGGRHGYRHGHYHGHNHGNSVIIGLDFVFTPFTYAYPYYPPAPVYAYTVRNTPPPGYVLGRRPYSVTREKPAYCREYAKKIMVDGEEVMAYGTACLQDNGSWRIMN